MTKCWIVISSLTQSVQGDLNGPHGCSMQIFLPRDEVLNNELIESLFPHR